jgi:very-short-patch-repair endonuclease
MRYNVLKKHSTKTERIVAEILKELHIPFRHRWRIDKYEIDFLIGKYAVEINGHEQNEERNEVLALMGYVPIHFHNNEIKNNRDKIKNKLKTLC